MKRKLYDLLVPQSIKTKLYQMHVERYQLEEADQRQKYEASLPRAELSSAYISNLRVVPNKTELLGLMTKNSIVAEIGARRDGFSAKIIKITQPEKAYLIGHWPTSTTAENELAVINRQFAEEIQSGQVEIRNGDIADELRKLPDGSIDWIYLTSDNSYQNTFNLLEYCQLKLKNDGILAGANYSMGDWIKKHRYGVVEAVNYFCKKYGWEMILITNERNRSLSYALKRLGSHPG
jgi:predicted O-methyltransferase YrrM